MITAHPSHPPSAHPIAAITTYAECASHIQRETEGQSSVHHHQTLNHIRIRSKSPRGPGFESQGSIFCASRHRETAFAAIRFSRFSRGSPAHATPAHLASSHLAAPHRSCAFLSFFPAHQPISFPHLTSVRRLTSVPHLASFHRAISLHLRPSRVCGVSWVSTASPQMLPQAGSSGAGSRGPRLDGRSVSQGSSRRSGSRREQPGVIYHPGTPRTPNPIPKGRDGRRAFAYVALCGS